MKLIRKILKIDDNFISFLCGIISNIPITLLFTIQYWGEDIYDHILFWIWIVSFIVSSVVTFFAMRITVKKIQIGKVIESKASEDAKEQELNRQLEGEKAKALYKDFKIIFIVGIGLIVLIMALWITSSVFASLR